MTAPTTLPERDAQRTDEAPADPAREARATPAAKARAYFVHVYTASGVAFAFLALREMLLPGLDPVAHPEVDARWVFGWLVAAVLVDATDGPLARAWHVKSLAPSIDGRTIDDILDYLTFGFLPLALVYVKGWLPDVVCWTVAAGMLASLLGFASVKAKEEGDGFFRGFPSYWNVYAFYAGLLAGVWDGWFNAVLLWTLAVLVVCPIRLIYPNLAPPPWKPAVLGGAAVWTLIMLAMLPGYPDNPPWLVAVSLIYPAFYTVLSVVLDVKSRRAARPDITT